MPLLLCHRIAHRPGEELQGHPGTLCALILSLPDGCKCLLVMERATGLEPATFSLGS
jgi:hypothetical protein